MLSKKDFEIKQLVLARLKVLPNNIRISIGSHGDFNKKELIEHVEADDDIGKKIIEVEMHFLRSLKKGIFYED